MQYKKILGTLKARFHCPLNTLSHPAPGISEGVRVMFLKKVEGPRAVTLSDGTVFSRADLPPPETSRWVASRKLAVVKGVALGLISREEALRLYQLSEEEFDSWAGAVEKYGKDGLKITTRKEDGQR